MIKVVVKDAGGDGKELKVSKEGSLPVEIHDHPATGDKSIITPFTKFFTDSAGSQDMKVAGALTSPVKYSIKAEQDNDIFIKSIVVLIADAGASLNKFGNITALTNGVKFSIIVGSIGESIIDGSLKSNFDFVRLSGGFPSFGDGSGAFKANNVVGASEAYLPFIDFDTLFGRKNGIRLRKGSGDCMVWTVQDDTTGVDSFEIKANCNRLII